MTTTTQTPRLTERHCQCAACHRYFKGTTIFDAHRAWHPDDEPDAKNRRRVCHDADWMLEHGYVFRNGMWSSPPMTEEQRRAAGWL